jgi:hypothetical protein
MVALEAAAGTARSARTRYLAGKAALVLAEQTFERFAEVHLAAPFENNLRKKKERMKAATQAFNQLVEYELGEVTAAATFYLAEINTHFSDALKTSERPDGLAPQEMQEYELELEEQAFPFEEKAIQIHEKNLELIGMGIYNPWIDNSLGKLAKLMPARYDKPEVPTEVIASFETYAFEVERPAPLIKEEAVPPPAVPDEQEDDAPAAVPPAGPVSGPVPGGGVSG